jgi:hypothetical protein
MPSKAISSISPYREFAVPYWRVNEPTPHSERTSTASHTEYSTGTVARTRDSVAERREFHTEADTGNVVESARVKKKVVFMTMRCAGC